MFSAIHYCTKIKHDGLLINKLLEILNENHVKKSGLFLYIKEMLIIILYNICTSLELVNSAWGMTVNIVSDPNSKLSIQLKYQLEWQMW